MADLKDFTEPALKAAETMRETARESAGKFVDGGSALGHKMLDQAEANTRQAFAAMRAAAEAKDLSEVMKIQGDFIREQGGRSMNQAREIGEMILQFGREVVVPKKD